MMERGVSGKVDACRAFHIEQGERQNAIRGHNGRHMISNRCIQVQIISENISDDHVIAFQASEHCKGPYSRKP